MSAYALPGFFPPIENSFSSLSSCSTACSSDESLSYDSVVLQQAVSVSVKDARVDPLRLIQSLTQSSTKKNIASTRQLRRRSSPPIRSSSSWSSLSSTHEEAMDFELSVHYCGRKYSLLRTLCRIRQLREDLLHEGDCGCTKIPELPSFENDPCKLGFTLLQEMLRQYSPLLEGWFREVLTVVSPDLSPCLTDFFYESLLYMEQTDLLESSLSSASKTILDSIEESEADTDE